MLWLLTWFKILFDDLESSWVGTTEAEKNVEQQKGLVCFAMKSASSSLNRVAGFRERLGVSDGGETDLMASASVVSGQIARTTAELGQVKGTKWIENKKSANIAQLRTLINDGKVATALYDTSEKELKGYLVKATTYSTQVWKLFDSTREQVARLQESLDAKHAKMKEIVHFFAQRSGSILKGCLMISSCVSIGM